MPDTLPYLDFVLPANWEVVTVSEIAEDISSGFPSGQHNQEGRGVPHLRPMNISPKGDIVLETLKYVEQDGYDALLEGDVLFNNTNSPAWVGKTAYIRKDSNWAYSNHMTRIRPHRKIINAAWLANSLHFIFETGFFRMHCSHHVNQASINTAFLGDVKIPLPPPPEQHRIVAEIEKQFTRLDAAVANLRRVQTNLQRYKASVLKAACEGRLVPQEATLDPDYEPADKLLERILAERRRKWEEDEWQKLVERAQKKAAQSRRKAAGQPHNLRDLEAEDWEDIPEAEYGSYLPKNDKWKQKYVEPEPPDTEGLPELPEGWVWATVDMLAVKVTDGVHQTPNYIKSGVPFLSVNNMSEYGELDFTSCKYVSHEQHNEFYRRCDPERGDLLLSKVGTIGLTATVRTDVEFSLFVNTALIKPIREIVQARFVEAALRHGFLSDTYSGWISGSTQKFIGISSIRELPIPLPSLNEQTRIADEFERRMTVVQTLESVFTDTLVRMDRLRQSILQQAFTGKLVPQDPGDEPAAALLERIKGVYGEQAGKSRKNSTGHEQSITPTIQPSLFDEQAGDGTS